MKHDIHKVTQLERSRHHHFAHKIHKKHRISYKTLFYMKEYGPHSHVARIIIKESLTMLTFASVISSIGGVHLHNIQNQLVSILPLLILLPALASLIGSFGTVVSSKFTTMLYLGLSTQKWWHSEHVKSLVKTMLVIAIISSFYIGSLSYVMALLKGFEFSTLIFLKVMLIAILATLLLIGIIIIISIYGGLIIYKNKEDPNNFLIPISTSIADYGSLLLFSLLVTIFF